MPKHGRDQSWPFAGPKGPGVDGIDRVPDGDPRQGVDEHDEGAGERIRLARRSRGLTQDQLAQAMGVSRSAVAQWETGRSGFNSKVRRIAEVLAVPVRQLQPGGTLDRQVLTSEQAAISLEEVTLLRHFRELDVDDQECLLRVARKLAVA